ncbi:hypothetical protein MTYP_02024 [Methylophilaceae bacterium]|nr:hypothetical protein MTYP_02024 [Methylophilaceae bacterium]
MSRKFLFFLWAVVAWITPAIIAGMLGWKGIWGSGSAFADYLVPVPVSGGAFHLPSFIAVSLILFTQPWAGKLGGYVRGILLAGALVGIATLLDLDKLQLAATTDVAGARFWQQQPLGLFILTDCVIAQLFVRALEGRWPEGAKEWAVSLIVALAIPAAYAAAALQADPRQQNPFVYAGARGADQRGDEMVFYYSKLPVGSDAFRQAASDVLAHHDPRMNVNAEDIALHFYDSLASAQAQDRSSAKYTVCLYQDGTAATWNPGSFDCFRDHESFSERFEGAFRAQDKSLPQDVRIWLARRDACVGREPLVASAGIYMDNQEVHSCDAERTERARQELLERFESDDKAIASLTYDQTRPFRENENVSE